MESIAEETLHEILLKLPTRDVARCRSVCKQWSCLLADPSFVTLHAYSAHIVSGAGAEGLLVAKADGAPGRNAEIVLCNLSSAMPMCRFSHLDTDVYRPSNACNGFICLVSDLQAAPVMVCNPAIGEKLQIPAPPKVESISDADWHLFAMGFSPFTRQYKLFRLTFPVFITEDAYLDVYTLGDNAGWRGRRLHICPSFQTMRSWPVLVGGKLYVVTRSLGFGGALDEVLAIDVTSEAVRTQGLPKQHRSGEKMITVDALELHGQLCVAVHDLNMPYPRLTFWVLTSTMADKNKKDDDDNTWELRYSFDMDALGCTRRHNYHRCECHPRGAWLQDGDVLCYLTGGRLYKYDTSVKRRRRQCSSSNKERDHWLSVEPSDESCEWNVYGGYCPSLLSPHGLATSSSSSLHQHHHRPFKTPLLLHKTHCSTPYKKRSRSPCPYVDNVQEPPLLSRSKKRRRSPLPSRC